MMCEEVISAIGKLRRRSKGPMVSMVNKGISYADMAKSGMLEKKTVGKTEARRATDDVSDMQML